VARIAVIGIGNVLQGDDALGPTVVRMLEADSALPDDVEVIDAGTPGLGFTSYLPGFEAIVVVDAVEADGAPGELRVYDKAGVLSKGPVQAMSPHEPGLRESLLAAELQGACPRIVKLVGVVVATPLAFGCALTPEAQAALPRALAQVKAELAALGVPVAPRVPPRAPDLWWARPAAP